MTEGGEGRFYARVFGVVAGSLLALALFSILRHFLGAILWAGLLAFLLAPLNRRLTQKLGGRPGLAAFLLTLAGALFVLVPAVVTAMIFAGQATELLRMLERLAEQYRIHQPSDLLEVPAIDQFFQWLARFVPVPPERIRDWAFDGGTVAPHPPPQLQRHLLRRGAGRGGGSRPHPVSALLLPPRRR